MTVAATADDLLFLTVATYATVAVSYNEMLVPPGPVVKKEIEMEKLYSVDEAAELLRLSHWTIWSWLKTGKLRGAKVGDRRVIRESELLKLVVDDPRPSKVRQ